MRCVESENEGRAERWWAGGHGRPLARPEACSARVSANNNHHHHSILVDARRGRAVVCRRRGTGEGTVIIRSGHDKSRRIPDEHAERQPWVALLVRGEMRCFSAKLRRAPLAPREVAGVANC